MVEPSKTDISKSLETGIKPAKGEERTGKTMEKVRFRRPEKNVCAKKEEM